MMKKTFVFLIIMLFCSACLLNGCAAEKPAAEATVTLSPIPTPHPTVVLSTPTPAPEPTSLTTGLPWSGAYKPVGIIIENSAAARPQSNIALADIVYEMVAEGGITRFFCLFSDNMPDIAGPVRSTRVYFIDIQQEWDCAFVHYGGPNEEPSINIWPYIDKFDFPARVDGYKGKYSNMLWRDNSRRKPHNAYVNPQEVQAMIPDDYTIATPAFRFEADAVYIGDSGRTVEIHFRSSNIAKFEYDAAREKYLRYVNGDPFMDRVTEEQITAKNIIVQYAKHHYIKTSLYTRLRIDLIGSGKAEYFINGKHIEGSWERESVDSQTVYYDQNGEPISFAPGNTWVEVVRLEKTPVIYE